MNFIVAIFNIRIELNAPQDTHSFRLKNQFIREPKITKGEHKQTGIISSIGRA